jgi:large subunit ribosomal protein L24
MKVHVKKGDTVQVISGKDAASQKKGKVLAVDRAKGRVLVEGINMVKRHTKPSQSRPQGGILTKEAPIASSNVMIYCDSKAPVRVNKQFLADGRKVRVCNKCGEQFDK